jgi:tRNA pseudouridine38-40 synthase
MTKFRATVSYDGTEFIGFQRQAAGRTVQGELEQAIEKVCGEQVTVIGAGRTDTGVHATGQVIGFAAANWKHGIERLQKAINVNLPFDVAVRDVADADDHFHPRFSAASRTYEYSILVSDVRQPLARRYAWHLEHLPDVDAMNGAADRLIGTHDFAAFGSAPEGGTDTVRTLKQAHWTRDGNRLTFLVESNAFLFRMVRRIVATLVRAGQGKDSAEEIEHVLHSRNPDLAKGAAPACGLCLISVSY